MRSCWRVFIVSGVFKLLGDLCGLVGPLSISYIVDYISSELAKPEATPSSTSAAIDINDGAMRRRNVSEETVDASELLLINYPSWSEFIVNGWIMSGIVLISFLLQGTFSQASTNLINLEGLKIKNALQGLIYRKTLSLSASCFHVMLSKPDSNKNSTAGSEEEERETDDDYELNNPGTITNLMSEDSLNVMTFFWICHYAWSIPLKVKFLWLFSDMTKVINTTQSCFYIPDRNCCLLFVPQARREFINWIPGNDFHDAASPVSSRSKNVKEFREGSGKDVFAFLDFIILLSLLLSFNSLCVCVCSKMNNEKLQMLEIPPESNLLKKGIHSFNFFYFLFQFQKKTFSINSASFFHL